MQLNTVTLVGTLATDPDIRYDRAGVAHSSFRLVARTEVIGAGDNPQIIDVRCDADLAENVALSLVRGSRVIVAGTIVVENSKDGDDGTPMTTIHADEVGPTLRFTTVEIPRPDATSHR